MITLDKTPYLTRTYTEGFYRESILYEDQYEEEDYQFSLIIDIAYNSDTYKRSIEWVSEKPYYSLKAEEEILKKYNKII